MAIWQEKRLGEVAELKYGYVPDNKNMRDEGYPIFSGYRIVGFCNTYMYDEPQLIVIARGVGGTGQVKISPPKAFITNLSIILELDENIVNKYYLYYYFKCCNLKNLDTGSAQSQITIRNLSNYKVMLHDIKTQEKIADILSAYDDLIENNNRRIEILEQMAQEIYKEWFVRFRFPGHEKVKYKTIKMTNWLFGNDPITMIPNSWHIGNVSELDLFKRGSNLTSATMINGDIPVISAGIQPSGYHNVANVFGQSISVSASGANAGYLLYHLNDIWASDCSYLQSEYIWFIYNSLKFLQPVLNNLQCGAAQPHVYPKQINKIPIIIPTNEILKQYCSKVEPIYEHIKNLKEKNQNLIKQRDLLLPRLMSGKLEV